MFGKPSSRFSTFRSRQRQTDDIRSASRWRIEISVGYLPTHTIDEDGGYTLQPDKFILGQTLERSLFRFARAGHVMPARIEGRSSFARIGLLVHFTAPTIHAGFRGNIALEMINLADYPITLYPGMEVCQLIVEPLILRPSRIQASFRTRPHPTGPR